MAERSLAGQRIVLEDAIDMHVHFGPEPSVVALSHAPHGVDPIEAATDAGELGMAAIVLKPHEFASTMAAYLANQTVGTAQVFGGICCDYPVGGLNPVAVETALRAGAKVVWLPTVSSRQTPPAQLSLLFGTEVGIPVIDPDGELLASVATIMDLVLQYDALLATGHISREEHVVVARAFGHTGRLMVTHAMQEGFGPELSARDCVELADMGATIELTAHSCMGTPASLKRIAEAVQAIGAPRIVMSSDYGWTTNLPKPAVGLRSYIDALWEEGATEPQLRQMACENPARLLRMQ
jgi:hypothetical protein